MQQLLHPRLSSAASHSSNGWRGGLRLQLINARDLTAPQLAAWRDLQASNPELSSPCFAPEFVQAVASVYSNVEVGVLGQGRQLVAFFPFQRRTWQRGGPVGGIVSDFQGMVCRPDFICDPQEVLRACHLVAWDFDRLLSSQTSFAPYHRLCEPSARIDLSQGYEAYASQRRRSGTHQIQRCEYLTRRLERELGPVRFVHQSSDRKHLAQVLAWKSEQYRRTGWQDIFARTWGRALVERVHGCRGPGFAGMLSLLFAGNRLLAGHLGMRSVTVWHYWFPAYDRTYAKYSPGLILLLKMAQHAAALGIECIDIGTGLSLYKKRLMNSSIPVAEGSVERPSCLSTVRSIRRKLGRWVKVFAK